jgi:hypothetical protein
MNDKLGKMRNELVKAYFKALSRHLHGETEYNHIKLQSK